MKIVITIDLDHPYLAGCNAPMEEAAHALMGLTKAMVLGEDPKVLDRYGNEVGTVQAVDEPLEAACQAWWEQGGKATRTWAQAEERWKPDYRDRMAAALTAAGIHP